MGHLPQRTETKPVETVFQNLLATTINPSRDTITQALASRQRCLSQLGQLAMNVPNFPNLASQHLDISPIFRKTQIRPLRELKLLLLLQAPKLEPNPSPILPEVY